MAGAVLYDEKDNQVGMVTSSTVSPVLSNACIALGYLKKPFFATGTKVRVAAEGAMREAEVVGRRSSEKAKGKEKGGHWVCSNLSSHANP